MRALTATLLMLLPAPLMAQAKLPELPRLMTSRAIGSLPAAAATETFSYGESASQKVELFLPSKRTEGPLPVVVLIHGGCWSDVAGPESLRPMAGALIDQGYAVWLVGYRRVGEEGGGYPGTFQDVAAGIDLLRDKAADHNLDIARVLFAGHSAGGHLALWAAGRPNIPTASQLHAEDPIRPRGVLSISGFGSIKGWAGQVAAVACGAETIDSLLAPGEGDERFADVSPDKLLPLRVPVILLHGIYDEIAFPGLGLSFVKDARAAGDKASIQLAPVTGHYEGIAPGTPAFAQGMAAIRQLLP